MFYNCDVSDKEVLQKEENEKNLVASSDWESMAFKAPISETDSEPILKRINKKENN